MVSAFYTRKTRVCESKPRQAFAYDGLAWLCAHDPYAHALSARTIDVAIQCLDENQAFGDVCSPLSARRCRSAADGAVFAAMRRRHDCTQQAIIVTASAT